MIEKKFVLSLLVALFVSLGTFSQAPQEFKYQAIARDGSGSILVNESVGFYIRILQTSSSGSSVYEETHVTATNQYGLVVLSIGTGMVVSGDFSAIDWGSDAFFLEVSLDETGGTSYTLMGTSQLVSVPYALYAETAGAGPAGADGLNCWDLNGDGVEDPSEDTNGDGSWDALDCVGPTGPDGATGPAGSDGSDGADGLNCWDLDGDGIADPSEDINSDGSWDALDCAGATGPAGTDGADGADGVDGESSINGFAVFEEQQPTATDGGTFTSGSWATRTLNTDAVIDGTAISRSGNVITLEEGTYYISATVPANQVGAHQARFYNTTAAATALLGGSCVEGPSVIDGFITVSSTSNFEIQHQCTTTKSTDGLGVGNAFGENNIYTRICIMQVNSSSGGSSGGGSNSLIYTVKGF